MLVAVTATTRETDGVQRVRLNRSYVRALEGAGLVPLVVPPLEDPRAADAVLGAVQGLVLTGGEDVDPAYYGSPRHPLTHEPNSRRDATEIALAEAARRRALPTLAICRGIQLVNVALGGSLVQDVPSERSPSREAIAHDPDAARDTRSHDIAIDPRSRLAAMLGDVAISVNSSHHQSIARLANGLRISATAPDDVVEAVEWSDDDWWMIGVQWHPEELVGTPEAWDRRLFDAFAAATREAHVAARAIPTAARTF